MSALKSSASTSSYGTFTLSPVNSSSALGSDPIPDSKFEEETRVSTPRDNLVGHDQNAKEKVPWWSYIWDYEPGRSEEERRFISKLDVYLITLLSLGYFIKNLDQTNIAAAFVSGMKEDLQMNGNEVNLMDTSWTIGYVIGQIPSQIIITKVRPSIWVPSCELLWTMLTFCLAGAKTSNQVIAIRFFVGLAESIFYPAAHTILGSWYKPSELGKRACIFHASSAAAGMFSGYLQAAVYKGLNGAHGFAGWQWLFVGPFLNLCSCSSQAPQASLLSPSKDHGRHHKRTNLHRRILPPPRPTRKHTCLLPQRRRPHLGKEAHGLRRKSSPHATRPLSFQAHLWPLARLPPNPSLRHLHQHRPKRQREPLLPLAQKRALLRRENRMFLFPTKQYSNARER